MKNIARLITAPLLSLVIIMLGSGFFNTFISVRISLEGGGAGLAGLVYSSYYCGMMVGSIYMEHLIQRIGHIRAFAIFASLTGSFVLMQGFIHSMIGWLFFRFIVGAAGAGLFIVIESWLLLLSSPRTRGKILSFYMIALYAAQGSGQFLLNGTNLKEIIPFCITAILASLSVIPVCLMKASYPTLHETERVSIKFLLKKSPLGFVGCFAAGLVLSSFYALGPIYGKDIKFNIFQISQIMGFTILGGLALQSPLGYLSDIFERRKVIIFTSAILAITSFLILFSSHYSFYVLILLFIIFGGFSFTLYPLSITYCCDFFSSAGITAITASCLIIYGTGCIIGPLAVPIFMHFIGPNGLLIFCGIVALLLTLFGLIRSICRPPPPKEMHEEYFPLPRVSPQAYQLDPRSEDEN